MVPKGSWLCRARPVPAPWFQTTSSLASSAAKVPGWTFQTIESPEQSHSAALSQQGTSFSDHMANAAGVQRLQLECSDCIGTYVVRAVNICGSRLRHTRHLQHCRCHEATLLSCHQLLAAQLCSSLGHAHVHWHGASNLISTLNPKQHLQPASARHVSAKHGCVGNIR